jgi:hypothetical protein
MKKETTTIEPQYEHHLQLKHTQGLTPLGVEKSAGWHLDPKRLVFVLSRYKFVAKMLSGYDRVLEVGCGDGFPIRIVLQEVQSVHGIDIDPAFIRDIEERYDSAWPFSYEVHDMLSGPVRGRPYSAAYCLDVLEHIPKSREDEFLANICLSVGSFAPVIIGMPSEESQIFASPLSKVGHVNCKSGSDLKSAMLRHFQSVFIFSMNDEVVHTGFSGMSHYLFALCVGKRAGT